MSCIYLSVNVYLSSEIWVGQKRKVVYNCVCVHVCVCLYCIYYISLLIELGRRGERGGGRYLISLDLDFFLLRVIVDLRCQMDLTKLRKGRERWKTAKKVSERKREREWEREMHTEQHLRDETPSRHGYVEHILNLAMCRGAENERK